VKPSVFLSSHVGERERGREGEIEDEEEERRRVFGCTSSSGIPRAIREGQRKFILALNLSNLEKRFTFSRFLHTLCISQALFVIEQVG